DCRDASTMAERTHRTLRALTERCTVEEHNLFISASAGIAMAPADATTVEELLSGSELALYDAKAAGGRTHRSFEPGLRARGDAARARRRASPGLRQRRVRTALPAAGQRIRRGGRG